MDERDFELSLLGPVRVRRDGRDVPITATRHRVILAALGLRAGETVSSDSLMDVLWGDRQPATARKAIQVYVSELRKLLEPDLAEPRHLVSRPPGYCLAVAPDAVDVARFGRLWRSGREALGRGEIAAAQESLGAALELWRGHALADLEFEDAFGADVRRLEEMRIDCIEDRMDADLAAGLHTTVTAELERLVEEFPLRERLQGQLVLALYRSGRQADALAAYQAARTRLVDELGIDPSPDLASLERRILQQDPSLLLAGGADGTRDATQVRPHHTTRVPAPVEALVGREDDCAAIESAIASGTRLVTLTGAGGSGKTRLAIDAAWRLADRFAGGAAFVELAPVIDGELMPAAIAAALQVQQFEQQSVLDAITAYLRPRVFLLVLDNLEHLPDAWQTVAELLRGCPQLTVLATSRSPLHISGELNHAVDPLEIEAAVALMVSRIEAASSTRVDDESEASAAAEICRRLDCLPLAIELAAARARLVAPSQLLVRLSEGLAILGDGPRDLPSRQRTLEATLDWSHDLLDVRQQQSLHELSWFAGGWTLEAAEDVLTASDAMSMLEALADASLIKHTGSAGGSRFEMLETVRQYAGERGEDGADARERYVEHYARLASQAALELHGPRQMWWMDRLEQEQANLRSALHWLITSRQAARAIAMAADLSWFWYVRGFWTEARDWLSDALAMTDQRAPARARALVGLGLIAREQGEYAEAGALLQSALDCAEPGDLHTHGIAMNDLAGVRFYEGNADAARSLLIESVALLEGSSDRRRRAEVLGNVAILGEVTGERVDEVEASFDRALAEADRSGDIYAAILIGTNLADLYVRQDRFDRACSILLDALEPAATLSPGRLEPLVLITLTLSTFMNRDFGAAARYHRRTLTVAQEIGLPRDSWAAIEIAGMMAFHLDLSEDAAMLLSWAQARAWPSPELLPQAAECLDRLRTSLGDEFAVIASEGRAMPAADVFALAIRVADLLAETVSDTG